jgi:serine/threonine-protein kinase SRPK3
MYFAIKVLTTYETALQKSSKSDGLDVLTLASRCYLNLYDSFTESSHHGEHLCLVLDVAGPSYEFLRLSSPTKPLPGHIVQRAVACVLEELEKLHDCGLIHGGSYLPFTSERENIYSFCAYIAVTAGNIVFEINPSPKEIDGDFESAKLPPCTIEHKVIISGVEYPIVRSHPVPNGIGWNASWAAINRWLVVLINLGHGMFLRFILSQIVVPHSSSAK